MLRYWAALGLLCVTVSPISAQSYTQAEAAACRPDVFRLCAGEIPNKRRIIACLNGRRSQLSPACAQVFDPNRGQAANPTTRSASQPMMPTDGQNRWGR
jgi:hypothetical protein